MLELWSGCRSLLESVARILFMHVVVETLGLSDRRIVIIATLLKRWRELNRLTIFTAFPANEQLELPYSTAVTD